MASCSTSSLKALAMHPLHPVEASGHMQWVQSAKCVHRQAGTNVDRQVVTVLFFTFLFCCLYFKIFSTYIKKRTPHQPYIETKNITIIF